LDGTLLDSTWVWSQIDTDFLKKRGFEVPKDYSTAIMAMGFEEVAKYTIKRFLLQETKEDVMAEWDAMARDAYAHDVKLKKGVKELLLWLKKQDIKMAVATSNSASLFEPCLKNLGIYDWFHSFTETGDVKRGKEFPDVYLKAAEKMGVNPGNCFVFEDILPAVLGAKKGGFQTVLVREPKWNYAKEDFDLICDYAVDEIDEAISLLNQWKCDMI
jgi:HAD superfamily hydrolase (TIGR01509 family)